MKVGRPRFQDPLFFDEAMEQAVPSPSGGVCLLACQKALFQWFH